MSPNVVSRVKGFHWPQDKLIGPPSELSNAFDARGIKRSTIGQQTLQALHFYWLCVKQASQGTLELANAWFWVIGIPIVAVVGGYLTKRRLTIPDTVQGFLTLMVVSVFVTSIVFFVLRFLRAPAQLYAVAQAQIHAQANRIAQLEGQQPEPDWPTEALFYHIRPGLLERADERTWEHVGNDIRDALSLGRVHAWGRAVEAGIGKILGRPAMRPIEPTYWHSAHFTYKFFDDTSGDAPHTYTERGSGAVYTDLRVNRTEASGFWSRRPC
jgi:hypothetical protein